MKEIDAKIIEYYTIRSESDRLNGLSIEKLRTQELISRHLPSGNLRILDIGGGAGVYSFWLSEIGHSRDESSHYGDRGKALIVKVSSKPLNLGGCLSHGFNQSFSR